jgi:hypothetical protein
MHAAGAWCGRSVSRLQSEREASYLHILAQRGDDLPQVLQVLQQANARWEHARLGVLLDRKLSMRRQALTSSRKPRNCTTGAAVRCTPSWHPREVLLHKNPSMSAQRDQPRT